MALNRALRYNIRWCLCCALVIGVSQWSYADNKAAVVVGSFSNGQNAAQLKSKLQAQMQIVDGTSEVILSDTTSGTGQNLQRVIVITDRQVLDQASLLSHIKSLGYQGAWSLLDTTALTDKVANAQPALFQSSVAEAIVSMNLAPESRPPEPAGYQKRQVTESAASDLASQPAAAAANPFVDHMQVGEVDQLILGYQEGIPYHRISIVNMAHDETQITLDGKVDEPIWQTLKAYDNMIVSVPGTGKPAEFKSEYRLLATEKGLYVSGVMHQPVDTLVKRYSVRDDFIDRDTLGFTLDLSGEGLVGYWFIVALGDSLMDGKVLPERNYQRDWDGPWIGKSAVRHDGWSVEMYLPWSMMNMPETGTMRNIGFAFSRSVSHTNERYQWPGYPYSSARFVSALNQADVAGVHPRQQLSIIPFAAYTNDRALDDNEVRIGADLSWKPSPKLELSASLNPDFGAVEADDVVLNLKAAETFVTEKRLFFLEGNEVFDSSPRANTSNIYRVITNDDFNTTSRKVYVNDFIPTPISLMNTKRVGGTAKQVTVPAGVTVNRGETDRPTQLLAATKVTGQTGDFRYGVLAAAEDDVLWYGTDTAGDRVQINADGRDFAVARLLYENVSAARTSYGYLGTLVSGPIYDALVHSLDAHYTSSTGGWILDGQIIRSDIEDVTGNGALIDVLYNASPNLRHKVELEYFDENADISDLGFVRRNDYVSARYVAVYNKQQFTDSITNLRTTLVTEAQQNVSAHQLVGAGIYWRAYAVLPGRNSLRTAFAWFPGRLEDLDSRGNGSYRVEPGGWWNLNLATDAAKVISWSMSIGSLSEDLGDWTRTYTLGATIRPLSNVSIDLDINHKRRHGWLVYQGDRNFGAYEAIEWQPSLKFNWFMTPAQQIRLNLQWVGVDAEENGFWEVPVGDGDLIPGTRTLASHNFTVSRLTAQFRYRWEIAPLSDLFVVYNIGNSLPSRTSARFSDLFSDSFDEPTIDSLVVKLRYRFGN